MSSRSSSPTRPTRPTGSRQQLITIIGTAAVVVAVLGAGLAFLFASWLDVAVTSNAGWRQVDGHLATIETLASDLTIDVLSGEETTTIELVERRGDAIESELLKIEALLASESVEESSSMAWVELLSGSSRDLASTAAAVLEAPSPESRTLAVDRLESASQDLRADLDIVQAQFRSIEREDLSERERTAGSVLSWASLGVVCTLGGLLVLLFVARRSVHLEQMRVGLLSRQVNEDALTGLINRRGFNGLVSEAINDCANAEWEAAVLYMDLDGFKRVNDTLGHLVGDKLLIEVSGRLLENVRSGDVVARLGGDEFAVLLRWSSGDFEPTAVAGRIQSELSRAFQIGEHHVEIGASVGVRMIGSEAESAAELIRDADIAMYRSKLAGGASVEVHEASMTVEADKRNSIEATLHESVRNAPYRIVYEPCFDSDGSIVGAEAQVRWPLSDGTEVLHEDFAPVAVELGLSGVVDAKVLEQTAAHFAQLNATLVRPLWVSVLVDAEEAQSGTLDRRIAAALDGTGLDPVCLVAKITDRGASSRVRQMLGNLDKIRELGVSVSMEELPSLTEQLASNMIDEARMASQGRLAGDVVSFDELAAIVTEQQGAARPSLTA